MPDNLITVILSEGHLNSKDLKIKGRTLMSLVKTVATAIGATALMATAVTATNLRIQTHYAPETVSGA